MQKGTQQKQSGQSRASGRATPVNAGGAVRSGRSGHAVEAATSNRRPSGYAATGSQRAGAAASRNAKPDRRHPQLKRQPYNRRRRHRPFPWRAVFTGLGVALAVALLVVLTVNLAHGTHHQLPTITRIEDYTPEPYASPEATIDAGSEQGAAQEAEAESDALPDGDALTEAADFSIEPDIPAQAGLPADVYEVSGE